MKNKLIIVGVLFVFLLAAMWHYKRGGMYGLNSPKITVSGSATTQISNQLASFTAGVVSLNDNKDLAVSEVNSKITTLQSALSKFGIPQTDIQTQNISVYQMEEPYTDSTGRSKTRVGQWRVSQDLQIRLKDLTLANDLTTLLTSSGANNVYGPNFTIDENKNYESELLNQAIKNAADKARAVATAQNKQLGTIITITEDGSTSGPIAKMDAMGMGGGGAELNPGSTSITKTVSVTFQLK